MIWRRVLGLTGIALVAAACASTAGAPLTAAERCESGRGGGRWNAELGFCEGSGVGSGGGY